MKTQIKSIIKKIYYSFSANIISLLISIISLIFLPKFMDIKSYGVWQLYLFYTSYLGFFHFGWIDGIYLRYGGYDFNKLNKTIFTSQFITLLITELMISLIGLIAIYTVINDELLKQILIFTCCVLVPVIITTFANFILQITNQIKEYAILTLCGRILFFISLIIYFSFGNNGYNELIYLDIISKIISLFYGLYLIKDLFILKLDTVSSILKETYQNLNVGSKLLLANIAGMLILGIIRFGISQVWDVETFGKVSLTLNCSNFLMVFINALSVVFFPILKRTDESKLTDIYVKIRSLLTSTLLGFLIMYYPIKLILDWWLPKYQDALIYMAILLPICLFESKVSLLTNTYLKSLRQEKLMLKINFGAVILSLILTYITTVLLHNLNLAVLTILILFAFRSICSEILLGKLLKITLSKDILQEILLVSLFVYVNFIYSNLIVGFLMYTITFLIYIYLNKTSISYAMKLFR